MTDFFVLPGTRVPLEGSDMPSYRPGDDGQIGLGSSPGGDGSVVQVVDAEWGRRAAVARGLAGELAAVADSLSQVNSGNHYGAVPEGQTMFDGVGAFIGLLNYNIRRHVSLLNDVAAQCVAANAELHSADSQGGEGLLQA
ncbi:hypothetical protein ABLE94_01115 [Gordonia sp. VNK1]|uniref:hypothetical protein n=1 Tax=Gordonia oleivorans TaxID=3156618 RepID=UPI0032B45599